MDWGDERYVRLYTRDSVNWKLAPWQARAVLPLVLRKLDRQGRLDLSDTPVSEAVASQIELPVEVVDVGMRWWLDAKRATFRVDNDKLVMPQFVEAQEARYTDAARARAYRQRRRIGAERVTGRDGPVTGRDDGSGSVTKRDANGVTKRDADPNDANVTKRDGVTGRDGPVTGRDGPVTGRDGPVTKRPHSSTVHSRTVPSRTVPSTAEEEEEAAPPATSALTETEYDAILSAFCRAREGRYTHLESNRIVLNEARRAAVDQAVGWGFSVEDLCDAVRGFVLDTTRERDDPRCFVWALENQEKVEWNIERARKMDHYVQQGAR